MNGASGGTATATATATGKRATAEATAQGGAGGTGAGSGFSGGKGASVSGTASATGITTATATLVLKAGLGGNGSKGADGGVGGSQSADNDVSGTAPRGSLDLYQGVYGGGGGGSSTAVGGAGGSASSTLTFDGGSTQASNSSEYLSAFVQALGGNGGTGSDGAGGAATAYSNITALRSVLSSALAVGGQTDAASGARATATAIAVTGARGDAGISATADGGLGTSTGGEASAVAYGLSASGNGSADATTGVNHLGTQAVYSAQADANMTVITAASAQASLAYGNHAFATTTAPQSVVKAVLAPAASSSAVQEVLAPPRHSAIAAAFATAQAFYAVGEIGVAHATGGTDSESNTDTFSLELGQAHIPSGHDLVLGLYGGELLGSRVTQVVLKIDANGTITSHSFSGAQAVAEFTDSTVNLGALAASGHYDLTIDLTVKTDSAGSGFYGDFIVGNANTSMAPPSEHGAMTAFSHGFDVLSHGDLGWWP
jgi:hypothetical protein